MSAQTTTAWVPDDRDFGTRLALIRHRMGWNQKEAALACGFPQNSWRGWEEGRHPRDLATVASRIHERTGVDEFWLLTGRTTDEGPRPTGRLDEGQNVVRHQGLEPRTRWLVSVPPIEHGAVVLDLDAHRRPAA